MSVHNCQLKLPKMEKAYLELPRYPGRESEGSPYLPSVLPGPCPIVFGRAAHFCHRQRHMSPKEDEQVGNFRNIPTDLHVISKVSTKFIFSFLLFLSLHLFLPLSIPSYFHPSLPPLSLYIINLSSLMSFD